MRRRRGNLLVSALFMAAFLFFLSVALTVTNREDIRSTLLADHKMRAEMAADGCLEYALQLMRNQPNWEESLRQQTFASGAVVELRQRTTRPGFVEITAQANSNLVKADRHLLLEEFRLADSVALTGLKPHLFMLRQGQGGFTLSVLGPNFRWQDLGAQSADTLPKTLSAQGGPLFLQESTKGSVPPVLQDWQPSIDAQGIVHAGGFGPVSQTLPQGNGALIFRLEQGKFVAEQIPDPGDTLGRVKQATINGSENGQPTYTPLPTGGMLDTSEYQGPCVEWYILAGTAAAAGPGNTYYCHGRHLYFRGVRFRNTAGSTPPGQVTPGGFYDEPCILKYTKGAPNWEKVVDLLKVTDDLSEPEVVGGPRPDISSLWVTSQGKVFCKQAGEKTLLSVVGNQFAAGSSYTTELIQYRESLLATVVREDKGQGLSQFDPASFLPKSIPGRNLGATLKIPGVGLTFTEEPGINLVYNLQNSPSAAAADDLFVMLGVNKVHSDPNSKIALPPAEIQLAHFDGKIWQILPRGLPGFLGEYTYFVEAQRDLQGTPRSVVGAHALALAGYNSDQPLLRRYVPLLHY